MKTRKDRLKANPDKLFTGDFWNGDEAVNLGLADSLGDLSTALMKGFGMEFTQDYTPAKGILDSVISLFSNSTREMLLSKSDGLIFR
jgi:protease-4